MILDTTNGIEALLEGRKVSPTGGIFVIYIPISKCYHD
jgi:hypothetical protein